MSHVRYTDKLPDRVGHVNKASASPVGKHSDATVLHHRKHPHRHRHHPKNQLNTSWRKAWKKLRSVLLIWALAVWALLVLIPSIGQIHDMKTAMLHLPYIFIGLGLVGAMFAAYSLRSDGHLLWFLSVLLLLAGWV